MFSAEKKAPSIPIVYILSLLLSFLWLLIIFAGPLLYKLPANQTILADWYYYLFHFTCHQHPARCYWIFDYQLPVCVRCLGIYAGMFLGVASFPIIKNVNSTKLPRLLWLIPCFVPIGIDGISQTLMLYPSPHWLRLLTGILCGFFAVHFILPGLNDLAKTVKEEFSL